MRLSPAGTARNRQGECDRRSPSPSGRITLDTRVIIANFSARYAEMITRVSLAIYRTVRLCSLTVGDRADRHHAHWQRGLSSSLSRRDYAITPGGHVPRSWLRPARRRPAAGDERATLTEFLRGQRLTLQLKCDGLDAGQLARRAVEPSTMSLLGLVRHLAEVERGWFRRRFAGFDVPKRYQADADPDATSPGRSPIRRWSRRRGARRSPSLRSS